MGKLSGIRVVDPMQYLPGPMMTLMMADQGPEVIKIEPPGGDPARAQAPFEDGQSMYDISHQPGGRARFPHAIAALMGTR